METIIYTNNKRQGSNYQVDRIVYSEGIDVKQIIQNEMERENISHIHFWFVRENVNTDSGKESSLLINFGKYLIENKEGNFKFQYIVERYKSQKKENKQDYQNSYNNIDYIDSTSQRVKRDSESLKLQKSFLRRDQLIRQEIKFGTFRDFQAFIRKEMNSNLDPDIIKKYLFRTNEQSIAVSFFQSIQLKTIEYIIEEDSDQIYNAKLHFRKISTIHPEDFQKNKKKITNYQQPNQLYHRLILFLFSPQKIEDLRDPKKKRTYNLQIRSGVANKIQANQSLALWRIKQQVDAILKYQKQCDLIKQEIENEKLIFRNKIKLIENYIGDSINVQKLFQEEEQLVGSSITAQANSTFSTSISKKIPFLGKRSSMSSANSQMIGNIQKLSRFNQASSNTTNSFLIVSEFKRLKEISETIRNIDNTIIQQNRKKQQLHKRVKQLAKEKQEILFRNAKELNDIRKATVDLKKDIERKQSQIKQKCQSGQFKVYLSYKTRQPSELAKQSLKNHIAFLNQYQQQSQKNNGTIFNEFDEIQYVQEKQERQTNRNTHINECKDITNANAMKLMVKRSKDAEKTKQIINSNAISKISQSDWYKSISKSSHTFGKNTDAQSNKKLQQQLHKLYQYYKTNRDILEQASKQVLACHRVTHKSYKSNDNSPLNKQFNLEMNLFQFPLLEQIIQFKSSRKPRVKVPFKHNQTVQPKIQSIYDQDYFSQMINPNTKANPNNITIHQKANMNSIKQTFSESFSDINNMKATSIELLQKNLVNTAKVSKFKRITIQQAINKNQLLKRVRINSKEDD